MTDDNTVFLKSVERNKTVVDIVKKKERVTQIGKYEEMKKEEMEYRAYCFSTKQIKKDIRENELNQKLTRFL